MIYQAHIKAVGSYVADGLADNLLITFLESGPADCLEYALALQPVYRQKHGLAQTGDLLTVGQSSYRISAVGSHAMQSLAELGHLTLVFDAATVPRHQGALHLEGTAPALPSLQGELTIMESAQ